jgi:hypothetical protein
MQSFAFRKMFFKVFLGGVVVAISSQYRVYCELREAISY